MRNILANWNFYGILIKQLRNVQKILVNFCKRLIKDIFREQHFFQNILNIVYLFRKTERY